MVKLNLGSGSAGIDSWLNYDWGILPWVNKMPFFRDLLVSFGILPIEYKVKWPKLKLVDIRRKLPNSDNSVNYIYCSHVLEHFEKYETESILRECFRILKHKGMIRIVLPDLKIFIENYKFGDASTFCNNFFGWYKDSTKRNFFKFAIRDHKWMYDSRSFEKLLVEAGFSDIKLKKFREGEVPDIKILDQEYCQDHSFYVEAVKK